MAKTKDISKYTEPVSIGPICDDCRFSSFCGGEELLCMHCPVPEGLDDEERVINERGHCNYYEKWEKAK